MTRHASQSTLALLGLGHMGSSIGRKLREAGYELVVWNRTRERAEAFASDSGAMVAPTAREAADRASIVLTSVSDDRALRAVMLGVDGALAAAGPGKIFVETSSVLPETQRAMARLALERGAGYIDAPISGSTPQLDLAVAIVLAGGDPAIVEKVTPILRTFSKSVIHFGEVGSGATMKLCVNILLALGMQAVADATALGTRAGLDRDALLDGLAQMAVISPAAKLKLENVKNDSYPETFPVVHMAKDLRLAMELAKTVGLSLPATEVSATEYAIAAKEHAGSDFSVIARSTMSDER